MGTRKFNTRQFIDAMEKNGYRKAKGRWIQFKGSREENGIYAACAGGQALLNLGVAPKYVDSAHLSLPTHFSRNFTLPNDQSSAKVPEIARSLKTSSWYQSPVEFEILEEFFNE